MPKEGLHRTVHYHKDPTYEQVLARYQKEQREAARMNRQERRRLGVRKKEKSHD